MIYNAVSLPESWGADVSAAESEEERVIVEWGRGERLHEVLSLSHEKWLLFI